MKSDIFKAYKNALYFIGWKFGKIMFLLDHTCVAEDFLEAISPPIIALLEGGSSITGEGCFALPNPPL